MAQVRLDLDGMTCASCAARIEKKLNKVEGVDATVNFATEQATVTYDPGVGVEHFQLAVLGVKRLMIVRSVQIHQVLAKRLEHGAHHLDIGEGTPRRAWRVQHHALGGGQLGQDAGR